VPHGDHCTGVTGRGGPVVVVVEADGVRCTASLGGTTVVDWSEVDEEHPARSAIAAKADTQGMIGKAHVRRRLNPHRYPVPTSAFSHLPQPLDRRDLLARRRISNRWRGGPRLAASQ
jgi:hypothetical protein